MNEQPGAPGPQQVTAGQSVVARGNIVAVPAGTAVIFSESARDEHTGEFRLRHVRGDQVVVVDWVITDSDHGEPSVVYMAGSNERYVPASAVVVLDHGDHTLRVGQRRVRGGGWGGHAASYMTEGTCACGEQYRRLENARQVRARHRDHVQLLAQAAILRMSAADTPPS